jgi:beta-glucosidase
MTTPATDLERFDRNALLGDLTLEEKASLVSGSGFWHTRAVERLGIPSIMVSDGPHGLRKQARGGDHVGAGASVPATCFPTAAALGSSWDAELVRTVGAAIGAEALAQGISVVLGPGINIKRSPLCGRNFEYLSEDPVVSGVLGAAMVEGIQSQGVGTSLKHYAANNQETDRLRVSASVDARTLREVYLAGFERVVRDAGPWTVMCSYNRINGVHASQDPWLLTEVLRGEWGFDGLVVSDWGAVVDPVAAVAAGLDLEMPSTKGASRRRIVAAVEAGELDEAVLDTAIDRVLGLVERALPARAGEQDVDHDAHHALARSVAAECAVLLKNDDALLPLGYDAGRIAVIGELARTPRYQGAGSSKVNPTRVDDALTALRADVGEERVVFAAGYGVDDPEVDEAALRAEAVDVASGADTVVLFLGLPPSFESEGYDRTHIDLPAEQVALVEAVAAVNDRVVVVLANGSAVSVAPWQHHAGALLEAWLGGQAGGGAVVDVLLGTVNPSGRLAETVPLRLEDTPSYLNFPGEEGEVRYGEGIFVGYRHYDAVGREVAYPFGHGLSYTTFAYGDLTVTPVDVDAYEGPASWRGPVRIRAGATVTNTGDVAGKEVVQCYVGEAGAPVPAPARLLKAFAKVDLQPGESTAVTFELTERDLSRWSVRADGWILEPGEFGVEIGASSRDVRLRGTVTVSGPRPVFPLDAESTLGEWLDHPVGRDELLRTMRDAPGGDLTPLLGEGPEMQMIASFPLGRLLTMLGLGPAEDTVDRLLAAVG